MKCPCHSEKTYEECCKPFHEGKSCPHTPEELMRSRYSAYASGLVEYIIETTHPDHPDAKLEMRQWKENIKAFSEHTDFNNLKIVNHHDNFVTFHAIISIDGEDRSFVEQSRFEQVDGKWCYHSGKIL